jgi:cytoskeletal protein CcmA (bactofilin family)
MTVFTRNDKPDTGPAASGPNTTPTATAQPIVRPTTPVAQPSYSSGAPSVSVISKALKITGQLESTEDIHIEGEVDGDVRGVAVKVGNNAKVKGTVYGNEVEVSGVVDGKIEAKKVVLTSTARMTGDVVHQDITIQSGAFMDGHCKPEYGKTQAAKAAAPALKPVGT